ncbi:MAG: hypothetical protein ACRD3K_09345 [Edaphobacter sp.]
MKPIIRMNDVTLSASTVRHTHAIQISGLGHNGQRPQPLCINQ